MRGNPRRGCRSVKVAGGGKSHRIGGNCEARALSGNVFRAFGVLSAGADQRFAGVRQCCRSSE
jgi:hypothetical protein